MLKIEDIDILNQLQTELKNIGEETGISFEDLPNDLKDKIKSEKKFKRFASIFEEYNAGEYFENDFGWNQIRPTLKSFSVDFNQLFIKQQNEIESEKIKLEKLKYDLKLSKWQVKTFWYVFIFGIIGGVYAIYSIIDLTIGESEEQKIERILENKLPNKQQTNKISTYQLQSDTLISHKIDKK